MIRKPFFYLVFLIISACAPQVSRIDPSTEVELSGRWNDSDSRSVADQMISQLSASTRYQEYAKTKGTRPTIIVGMVRNKTSEHIDAANYIKKLEAAIFNSGLADIVESGEFRDKLRVERVEQRDFADPVTVAEWGKETGADLMLFGEMTSETDVYHNQRVVNYVTTLFLTDMETNQRIWYGQQEIKKLIRK
jgi:uncharacterized protein (TIGR02722 family)